MSVLLGRTTASLVSTSDKCNFLLFKQTKYFVAFIQMVRRVLEDSGKSFTTAVSFLQQPSELFKDSPAIYFSGFLSCVIYSANKNQWGLAGRTK